MPEKLNICFVAKNFPILGRASEHGFLWPIAKGLAQKGHRVTVLSWKTTLAKEFIDQDGVHAYFLGQGYYKDPDKFPEYVYKKFLELHQQNPFHIVHSLDSYGLNVAMNKKQHQVATAFDADATHMSELFAIAAMSQETLTSMIQIALGVTYRYLTTFLSQDRKVTKYADGIFVTSPQQKLVLERYYLYPERRTYVVPYGIEIGSLSQREKSEALRQKLNLPGNANVVMTFTDMTEIEVIKNLLLSFEQVAIKKPSSRMIIVGSGPLRRQIEFEMLNLALGSKVIFTGAVNNVEMADYISLSDVFVNLSSRTSGFEPTLLEAMAQKKVIIGSEVSPIATIVEDGIDGFLIRPADKQSLSKLIIQVFTGHISSDDVGDNARKKVVNLFDLEKMLKQTLDAYQRILSHSGLYK